MVAKEVTHADLPLVIASETIHAAGLEEDDGVMLPARTLDHIVALVRVKVLDLLGICL